MLILPEETIQVLQQQGRQAVCPQGDWICIRTLAALEAHVGAWAECNAGHPPIRGVVKPDWEELPYLKGFYAARAESPCPQEQCKEWRG